MNAQAKQSEKTASTISVVTPEHAGMTAEMVKISPTSFAQYVRALMQNWRQGTVGVKGRSDVAYSNKKPWKQKGTGRARAGSARSPLWRGGGVTFGPQARTRVLSIPKNVKRNVLAGIAHQFLSAGKVVTLNWELTGETPKTAVAFDALKKAGLNTGKILMFLPAHDLLTATCFSNIPTVRVLFFDQPNAVDLVHADRWVVLNRDLEQFKTMVAQWI
jgi:large subunit ribosomal protein L4